MKMSKLEKMSITFKVVLKKITQSLQNISFLTVIHSLNTTDAQKLQLILPKEDMLQNLQNTISHF